MVVVVVGVVVVVLVVVVICRGTFPVRNKQDRQCTYKRISRQVHVTIVSSTHSECVSAALVIQAAMRVRRIILSPVWMCRISGCTGCLDVHDVRMYRMSGCTGCLHVIL
jgi:hypothetical protein